MKKKTISLMLAAAMAASAALTGCGNASNNSTPADTQAPAAEADKDEAGASADTADNSAETEGKENENDPLAILNRANRTERVTITMGRHTTTNPKLPDGETYEDNAYIRMVEDALNIDIVDEFEGSNEDYDRQVSLTVSAGSMPDIMKIHTQAELMELWENDMILDIGDVYETYASDGLKEVFDTFPEGMGLDRATIDGHLVALPSAGGDCAPMLCYVRQDWLDTLGITMDADHDNVVSYMEILDVARQFMAANPEGVDNPVGISAIPDLVWYEGEGAWGLNFISNAMNAWPQTWYEKDGKAIWGSTTEETREWLRFCNELYKEGVLDPQVGVRQWDDVTALMTNGQFGFAFGAVHTPNWGLVNVFSLNEKCEYTPYLISDENGIVRHKHSDSAQQGMIVVSKECKNPEVAIEIANLFYGKTAEFEEALYEKYPEVKEYDRVISVDHSCRPYNIEISSYDNNLVVANIRDSYFKGEITLDEAEALNGGMKDNLISIEAYMNGETKEPADWARYTSDWLAFSRIKTLYEYDKTEWIAPLFPSTTETMKTNWANLEALEAETFIKIVTGAVDVDEGFDSFVEQWNAQGGEQIRAEVAAQFGIN